MAINQPQQHVRLPVALGTAALAITAAALVASVVNITDPKQKKITDGVKGDVVAVLTNPDATDDEPRDDGETTDGNTEKLKKLLKELPQLPRSIDGAKPLDIPTARARARSGDIEAARFLIKTFDTMETSELPSTKDNSDEPEKIYEEILKELGISDEELALFRSADELQSRIALLQSGSKLRKMAQKLDDSGMRLMSGDAHESALLDMQYYRIMRLLCGQGGLGPGAQNEVLFLKLIGHSRQQLQDLARSVYDYYYQDPGLDVDMADMSCPDAIQETFGFPASERKVLRLEIRE